MLSLKQIDFKVFHRGSWLVGVKYPDGQFKYPELSTLSVDEQFL